MTYCKVCLNKQQKINELENEIFSLKTKLRYQERTAIEGFFGSSTPSAKIPVKPNRQKEHQRNPGGGKSLSEPKLWQKYQQPPPISLPP